MVSKIKQLEYWQGKFGDDYTKRNADLTIFEKRLPFFEEVLQTTKNVNSILEVGCNIGGNLPMLHAINKRLSLTGLEPNVKAAESARQLVPSATIHVGNIFDFNTQETFDLVFTSGVLIHIGDQDIGKAYRKIYSVSRKYILTIEYYAEKRMIIPYRGLTDALFKRPYDQEWLTLFPTLLLLDQGLLGTSQGFDNCHWWLFAKI